jgi:7,8-dihydropterin-6-yl-methyl-4-(beta-D-ribofuranosyl)aminobenzene 5'-phosphate synthase
MGMLAPVDRLEVLILVDNVTDNLSSVPSFVETEMGRVWRRGLRLWSGNCMCCAAHGLSCLVTAYRGDSTRSVLFDTGPEDAVLERNVERLGADLGKVEAMVLSHGHWDHGGGMLRALDLITLGNGGREVPTYMHPRMFGSRALKAPDGSMRAFADIPSVHQLAQHGATVVNTTEPQTFLDDMFHVSGEISRLTPYERGMIGQHRRTEDGTGWEPDPLIMDERFLAVNVEGKGLVVFTACSHAGVVNVMSHARTSFPGTPLHAVLGGFHLVGANERIIPETVAGLREFGIQVFGPAHCTGWRAVNALAQAFGEAVVPASVGKQYSF